VLLDGTATVQDVVAVAPAQADQPPTVFERAAVDAQKGTSAWRTVLVQGFGAGHSGYFALDVTNPAPDSSAPDDTSKGGPRMLWQLTRDANDKNLFGHGGGTPAIATLFFDPTGGTSPREIPVAILPGGPGGTLVAGGAGALGAGCPESGTRTYSDVSIDSGYTPRPRVRCYDFAASSEYGARSLTIVRLDTGEVVRTFRQKKTEVSLELQPRVTEVDLDVPISGQPVAFPGLVGQVADRVFVGDEDGRVWRVNVASSNPANWTMKLFFDLYPSTFAGNTGMAFGDGQPIVVPPLLTVDTDNNLIIDIASGDQESLGAAPNQSSFVYSLTEKVNATQTGVQTVVNWYRRFNNGTRVVGPMALFNGAVYFGTFSPVVGNDVCAVGTSEIWAMDYLRAHSSTDKSAGGAAVNTLDPPPTTPPPTDKPQRIDVIDNAVAFGLIVTQQPSCYITANDLIGDALLGLGGQRSLGSVSTGQFQLVYQTGSKTSGTSVQGAGVGVTVKNLLPPTTMSSIESWASIVE
jgi:type IV pilus assembly protein PilY1